MSDAWSAADPRRAVAGVSPVGCEQQHDPARDGCEQLDGWLAAAAADRDEGAFEQLVRRHTPALYAAALRTTGSPQAAQDVVQDAWLSAWLHLPGFRGQSQVRTWLVRITTTKALNALRRSRPTVPLEVAPEPLGGSTEQYAEQRERAAAVRFAVAALPVRQREAVVLRDLEGLSYEQVAAALDCSVGSVKSALFRGRQSLALALAAYRPGHEPPEHRPVPQPASPAGDVQRLRGSGSSADIGTPAGTGTPAGSGASAGVGGSVVARRGAAPGVAGGHP